MLTEDVIMKVGSPPSSVQGDAILESSTWKFPFEADVGESFFVEGEASHGRWRRTKMVKVNQQITK
jgi:hypothetical protein